MSRLRKWRFMPVQSGDSGQSMVEFAIGVVFALILLAGVVDGGRALFVYMALRDAAQEGAQYAIIDPPNYQEVISRTFDASNTLVEISSAITSNIDSSLGYLVPNGEQCAGLTMSEMITVTNGVRIRVTYEEFPLTMPFIGAIIGSQTIPISAVIEDTILAPPCPPPAASP